ncbi:PadR family transcriptional regulator [Cohnella sp. AR92]|nr:PadR family transcriptional regulator [Cohnella sp. AR92]
MNSQDVILGLLHHRPLSGYEIKGKFEFPLGFFFDASFGTIYPTLAKLESHGYIVKESVVQEGRPNKNIYSITEAGRERFQEYLQSPLEEDLYRSDLMVRLYFGEFIEQERMIGWIVREIGKLKRNEQILQEFKAEWGERISSSSNLCLNVGVELNAAKIKVLEEGLAKIQQSMNGQV